MDSTTSINHTTWRENYESKPIFTTASDTKATTTTVSELPPTTKNKIGFTGLPFHFIVVVSIAIQ